MWLRLVLQGLPRPSRRWGDRHAAPQEDPTAAVAKYTPLDILRSCRLTTFALMMCFVW